VEKTLKRRPKDGDLKKAGIIVIRKRGKRKKAKGWKCREAHKTMTDLIRGNGHGFSGRRI